MLQLGLSAAEQRAFHQALASSHRVMITCQILHPDDHRVLRHVDHILMDGQITILCPPYRRDQTPPISRVAQLTFLDPSMSLALDSSSPADGSFYMDRLIRVIYSVHVPLLGRWVDVPVFTGPIIKVTRDTDYVDVEAHGMEHYALGHVWEPSAGNLSRGVNKRSAIMRLLRNAGELDRYMDIPGTRETLVHSHSLAPDDSRWPLIWRIAAGMDRGRIAYYDGRGVFRCVPQPSSPAFTITEGPGGMLLGEPVIGYSIDGLVNAAQVTGANDTISRGGPATSHPLSRWRLGRNGTPWHQAAFVTDGDLRTRAAREARVQRVLNDSLMQEITASGKTLHIPHLEPYDVIQWTTRRASVRTRPQSFTLPLRVAQEMLVGWTHNQRRPTRPRGRI